MSFAGTNRSEFPREEDGRSGLGILLGEGDRGVVTLLLLLVGRVLGRGALAPALERREFCTDTKSS